MFDKLNIETHLTESFFDLKATDIHYLFKSPTLVHINKWRGQPIFLSCLIHGNENAGLYAIQKILKKYKATENIIIFIGNPMAAAENKRHLDSQTDLNRVWDKKFFNQQPMTEKLYNYVKEHKPYAAIDIHNTTGKNPHFSCINYQEEKFYKFAKLFGGPILYFKNPSAVLANILGEFCPSITIECGLPDAEAGVAKAYKYIDSILENKNNFLGNVKCPPYIYRTIAKIKPTESFDIGLNENTLSLNFDLEDFNFKTMPAGTVLGEQTSDKPTIEVLSNSLEDNYSQYFEVKNNMLIVKKDIIPAMITLRKKIIEQDCLCYIIERLSTQVDHSAV